MPPSPEARAFLHSPNRTLIGLSVPVLGSLVAEPVTGLVDTIFIAQLGSAPLAALGVGTIALSSVFWIFNFLGIGTQTEVAQATGAGNAVRVARMNGLALVLAVGFGVAVGIAGWIAAPVVATALGATGNLQEQAEAYIRVRLLGAPAVLMTLAVFGTMRGLQDMRTPLWIAVGVNALNIVLDALLIPTFGVTGAAGASAASQWVGVIGVIVWVKRNTGFPARLELHEAHRLLQIGGDLFVRTGLLTLFLLLTTRTATRISADAGAAHQAIRQVWMLMALVLDAFAVTGQSLVGYFMGAGTPQHARRVARVVCAWSLGTGGVLAVMMLVGEGLIARWLVPASAMGVFSTAWWIAAVAQPVNALSFATDGLHWGTGDYRYLRNAVIAATGVGTAALMVVDEQAPDAFAWVWGVTALWIVIRAGFGVVRIWPGVGGTPWRPVASAPGTRYSVSNR